MELNILKRAFPNHIFLDKKQEFSCVCPKCGDEKLRPDKKKLCINLDKKVFHCWVCDFSGKSIPRLLKMVNSRLADEYIRKSGYFENQEIVEEKIDISLPKDFRLIMDNLWDPQVKILKAYCNARGMSDKLIWECRIGYSSEMRGRIIIPSFDSEGHLNYWTARRIDEDPQFKYINSKVPKTTIVFGEIDIDWTNEWVFVVEGPFDWIKCKNYNCVPLLGSTLNPDSELFRKLVIFPEKIILALDSDARSKQDKIASMLMKYDKEVYYYSGHLEGDWGDLEPNQVDKEIKNIKLYTPMDSILRKINML